MDNEKEGVSSSACDTIHLPQPSLIACPSYMQFPITAIREIKILKVLNHKNVVRLKEIVTSKGASARPPLRQYMCSTKILIRTRVAAYSFAQALTITKARAPSIWSWSFVITTLLG